MAEPPRTTIVERCEDERGSFSTRTYTQGRFLGKVGDMEGCCVSSQRRRRLAQGGFAVCYEMTCNTTGAKFAGKIVKKQSLEKPKARIKFSSEIRIHQMLLHPQVVQFQHYFEDDANCYLLLELCQNQSLSDLLRRRKRLAEHEVRYYIKQLVDGIAYLHSQCVIHRDLKLSNLFLTHDMQLKIGDFGLASLLDSREEKRKTMCGTPNYIAPEILNGHHNNGHSFEVDIWSAGVVMYTLLVGKPPFETKDVKNTYKLIRAIDYTFPPHISISSSAKSLIMDVLQKDPTRRPTLAAILAHPFLNAEPIPPSLPTNAMFLTPPKTMARRSPLAQLEPTASSSIASSASRSPSPSASSSLQKAAELDILDVMASNLSTAFFLAAENSENVVGQEILQAKLEMDGAPLHAANLWVVQYVDYTAKYGLGYTLSNACTGVLFNDWTKIIADTTTFGYVTRGASDAMEPPQRVHRLSRYPSELTKKVTLVAHFKEYIEADDSDEAKTLQRLLILDAPQPTSPMVYVSKWQKTRHCVMFRLTNNTVQANFFDTTKLMLSHDGKVVTYLDKQDEMHVRSIYHAIQTRDQPDLLKRLKYAKEMLQLMAHNAKAA
ncbi:Aste57867_15054 [Aphanomyces stellatus]|uniref:Aste57867_15054 protein n=1 Tax=Aphanomyces stellatus TaxID=120398 RepID=A0A485L297_9STRA|nr:hypothetical protein As57867_014998 [Aphanomyces stellatus]VFT91868.1 Aste57867_15054 [Aphanomyces stellatus]